ncbi:glycosyltransferase [Terrihabitans rhizophilus]|uniref:Glycosyltransferase n=1 Tax=Terrihabitans rhizophilus TaxID=3092662 RepID=A0ABU4RSG2_9HYPH|nr:glycosyltransferase [Terrihabitans sp. PJ23]MDX6807093.1 glycosyltransferase [Terrihabitans sp. PJ23]
MRSSDIAVLMPAYNPDPVLLQEVLRSLLSQSEACDVVIVDDHSRVPISSIVAEDPRIRVLRLERNLGVTGARNEGLRYILAEGYPFIACNDADDVCLPERFRLQLDRFERDPALDILGGMSPTHDASGAFLFTRGTTGGPAVIRKRVRYNLPFAHSTFFFRSSVVTRFGDYSEDFPAGEDYEFLYRIVARGGRVDCLPEPLSTYLLNPAGITFNNWQRQIRTRLKTQLRYFDPLAPGCYLGVARTLITLMVPLSIWGPLKRAIRTRVGTRQPT